MKEAAHIADQKMNRSNTKSGPFLGEGMSFPSTWKPIRIETYRSDICGVMNIQTPQLFEQGFEPDWLQLAGLPAN